MVRLWMGEKWYRNVKFTPSISRPYVTVVTGITYGWFRNVAPGLYCELVPCIWSFHLSDRVVELRDVVPSHHVEDFLADLVEDSVERVVLSAVARRISLECLLSAMRVSLECFLSAMRVFTMPTNISLGLPQA